nr:mitochondrial intermembrane space import and assembly protein 40 homolog [Tanacetum cinerariifolium]
MVQDQSKAVNPPISDPKGEDTSFVSSDKSPPSMESLLAEATAFGDVDENASLEEKAQKALECPCIQNLKKSAVPKLIIIIIKPVPVSQAKPPPQLPLELDQLIGRIHQLDTTYRPFHSEQHIDLYSLNNGIMSNDVDRDHTNLHMIAKPDLKIGDEFLKILQDNSFNGMDEIDVTDHIVKVLEITEWIKIPNVDKDEL